MLNREAEVGLSEWYDVKNTWLPIANFEDGREPRAKECE